MADITYAVYIDWDNDGSVLAGSPTSGETVTTRVLNTRTALSWSFGRDTARSLSAIQPGQVTIELNNVSRDYSPDNASSPLYGNLGSGKPVLITATHNAITYNLFYGFIDDYSIDPFREKKSVTLTCIDVLAKLAQTQVSTGCYPSLQTGAAVNYVLDAAGWSSTLRDIDTGSTTLRYWVADGTDAWSAIGELAQAEGTPAIAYVDVNTGKFVFRDRQHRKLDAASITSQATFRDTGSEPLFSDPVEYNVGFRDLINSVDYTVQERAPQPLAAVWTSDSTWTIPAGQQVTINVHTEEPFIDAVTPVEGTDFTLLSGTYTLTLSRDSGQTTTITIAATTATYIQGMQLRAYSCPVAREFTISSSLPASVSKYGIVHPEEEFAPKWLSTNDAQAIGDRLVALRGERLPVISITVKNANDTRKVQQLSRTLSDRVTIVEAETQTNHDHYIEKVSHTIGEAGKAHSTTFGCERVETTVVTQFTFDVAGAGFDQGSFGTASYDNAATIFILDSAVSGHRLGSGKLAT